MKQKHFTVLGIFTIMVFAVAFIACKDSPPSDLLEGTWINASAPAGTTYKLVFANGTWDGYDNNGVYFYKGTYTISGKTGTVVTTHKGENGSWTQINQSHPFVISGNTVTIDNAITYTKQ